MESPKSPEVSVEDLRVRKRKFHKSIQKHSTFTPLYLYSLYPTALSYKLPGDLLIYDNIPMNANEEIHGLLSIHNNFKKIMSVITDSAMDLIVAKLENIETEYISYEVLERKLKNIGNFDAYKLEETLKKYLNLFKNTQKLPTLAEFNEKNLKNDLEYKDFCMKNADNMKKYHDIPVITFRFKNKDNSQMLEIVEIGFNECMVNLLSENKSSFIQYLIKSGFPDCIHMQENYFKFIDLMINQSFFKEHDKYSEELFCYVVGDDLPKIPSKLKFEMNSFSKKNYSECFLVDYFEIEQKSIEIIEKFKFDKNQAKAKMKNLPKKQKVYLNDKSESWKESKNFLNNYYPDIIICKNFQKSSLRCMVKELDKLKE